MSTQVIQIQKNSTPTPTQPAVFDPQAAVANAGDTITFNNADSQAHWPAPSAANQTGFFPFEIIAGAQSGNLGLAPNVIAVTAASPTNPVVFTTAAPAPANNSIVQIKGATGNWVKINGRFPATNVTPTSFSIDVKGSDFGPLTGTLTVNATYTLNYVCALHPAETGSITVNPQP